MICKELDEITSDDIYVKSGHNAEKQLAFYRCGI